MYDATYEQICKKVHRWSDSCEADVDFTAWVRVIQKARILNRLPEEPWLEDQALIQVRRMRAEHLESQVDLPESKHKYEDTLDVIKLPSPIPTDEYSPAPQFLFIRPDEYALFKCFGQRKWCILTGNPGISKSWFQWKFILFCYRQDLFDRFSPLEEREQLDEPKEDEEAFKKSKTENEMYTQQDQFEQKEPTILFIPKLIVQTVEGEESFLFFIDQISDVLLVRHSPIDLKLFTDENSTILWEPASNKTPVDYSGVKGRIIASVSSHNEELYHQFRKYAKIFMMPCPSELQIRLMGQIH